MSEAIPSSLTVYLSNLCNLACAHCYVAVNQGPAAAIDAARLREGLDYFLARATLGERKISFLGGEPLLHYPLLRRAVERIRTEAAEEIPVHVFTNGLLLDGERISFFRSRGVDVTVGFAGGAVRMPAAVRSALRTRAGRLGASVVVTRASVGELLGDVDRLYRAGFRRIAFAPDVGALWTARDAARLRAALNGFRRYYRALIQGGAQPFEVANIYEALAEALDRREEGSSPCDRLILAADGRFYACDKIFGAPFETIARWSVGSPREGLDGPRRRAFIREAEDAARDALGARAEAGCPAGAFSIWRIGADRSAERLRERMRSFGAVSGLLRSCLLDVAREHKENKAFRKTHHLEPDAGENRPWKA